MTLSKRITKLSESDLRRFYAKFTVVDGTCWRWNACKDPEGYGRFNLHGRNILAHRIMWFLTYGNPEDMTLQIDHKCHNKSCVNPAHLQLVTNQKNSENLSGAYKKKTDLPHSGYRGVTWNKNVGKWQARAMRNGIDYYVGSFTDVNEANRAVIALRLKLMTNDLEDRRSNEQTASRDDIEMGCERVHGSADSPVDETG